MKLKQWLREYNQMSYGGYKNLTVPEKEQLKGEHQRFCQKERIHDQQGWRLMTEQEKAEIEAILAKEKERYEMNLKIGGIVEGRTYENICYVRYSWVFTGI